MLTCSSEFAHISSVIVLAGRLHHRQLREDSDDCDHVSNHKIQHWQFAESCDVIDWLKTVATNAFVNLAKYEDTKQLTLNKGVGNKDKQVRWTDPCV